MFSYIFMLNLYFLSTTSKISISALFSKCGFSFLTQFLNVDFLSYSPPFSSRLVPIFIFPKQIKIAFISKAIHHYFNINHNFLLRSPTTTKRPFSGLSYFYAFIKVLCIFQFYQPKLNIPQCRFLISGFPQDFFNYILDTIQCELTILIT